MHISLQPIGAVRPTRSEVEDDDWLAVESEIVLDEKFPETSLDGIEEFSHVEIIFYMDQVISEKVLIGSRHPRNNPTLPKVGIFAQRAKNRPNQIGCTICRVLDRQGRILRIDGLDAVDNTPVLDIKPIVKEFMPKEKIQQPSWMSSLMTNYWSKSSSS